MEPVLLIAFVLLIIGSYTDIRTREIPDWLNYAGISTGLFVNSIISVYIWSIWPIMYSLAGLIVLWAIASLAYYTGQWGGGDAKALMAMGALLGLRFDVSDVTVSFFINLLIAGGLYGLLWSFGTAVLNHQSFVKEWVQFGKLRVTKKLQYGCIISACILSLMYVILKKMPTTNVSHLSPYFLILGFGLLFFWILYRFMHCVEQACFFRIVNPDELTEGDWIANEVIIKGKYICGPKDLGISLNQIKKLIVLHVKSVRIKIGIPFIPSFLIALILTVQYGNILFWLVLQMI